MVTPEVIFEVVDTFWVQFMLDGFEWNPVPVFLHAFDILISRSPSSPRHHGHRAERKYCNDGNEKKRINGRPFSVTT